MSENNMSFLDHLEELRWHIIRSISSILVFAVVAFFFKEFIFDTLLFSLKDPNFITYRVLCKISEFVGLGDGMCIDEIPIVIQNRTMSGQFSSHLWSAIIVGIVLSFPYFLWEIWRFIKPGLTRKEKKYSILGMFFSSLLFALGILFGYFLIAPLSINFLANYTVSSQIINEIDLSSFVSIITSVTLASGVIFQLPVFVYILTKSGLVTPSFLRKYRRHALVIVLVLAAVITPPDISSQVLIAIPMVLLYELSIKISSFVYKENKEVKTL